MIQRITFKSFGNKDPIAQIIKVENKYDFQVTGVLAELLHNSILQLDFLVPIEFLTEV